MCVGGVLPHPRASHPDDPAMLTLFTGGKNVPSIHPLLQATFSKYIPLPLQNKPIKKNTSEFRNLNHLHPPDSDLAQLDE